MASQSQIYAGAFADPVFAAQSVFRDLMDGFARPGTAKRLASTSTPPAPLGAAAGAVALTLCDHDTPVWLTPALGKSAVPQWIAFHTGAAVTTSKTEARFAFIEKGRRLPGLRPVLARHAGISGSFDDARHRSRSADRRPGIRRQGSRHQGRDGGCSEGPAGSLSRILDRQSRDLSAWRRSRADRRRQARLPATYNPSFAQGGVNHV